MQLAHAIADLWDKFFPYLISFFVLGSSWLSTIKIKAADETVDRTYAKWWLLYLLAVTCVPFSSLIVGRYGHFATATWTYAGNLGLLAFFGFRLLTLLPNIEQDVQWLDRRISLILLGSSCLIVMVTSLLNPRFALACFAINLFAPAIVRWYTNRQNLLRTASHCRATITVRTQRQSG